MTPVFCFGSIHDLSSRFVPTPLPLTVSTSTEVFPQVLPDELLHCKLVSGLTRVPQSYIPRLFLVVSSPFFFTFPGPRPHTKLKPYGSRYGSTGHRSHRPPLPHHPLLPPFRQSPSGTSRNSGTSLGSDFTLPFGASHTSPLTQTIFSLMVPRSHLRLPVTPPSTFNRVTLPFLLLVLYTTILVPSEGPPTPVRVRFGVPLTSKPPSTFCFRRGSPRVLHPFTNHTLGRTPVNPTPLLWGRSRRPPLQCRLNRTTKGPTPKGPEEERGTWVAR